MLNLDFLLVTIIINLQDRTVGDIVKMIYLYDFVFVIRFVFVIFTIVKDLHNGTVGFVNKFSLCDLFDFFLVLVIVCD